MVIVRSSVTPSRSWATWASVLLPNTGRMWVRYARSYSRRVLPFTRIRAMNCSQASPKFCLPVLPWSAKVMSPERLSTVSLSCQSWASFLPLP